MKILHVISAPAAGGAEVYVRDLAVAMKKIGHQVSIGFLGRAEDIGRDAEYQFQFLSVLQEAGIPFFFIGNEARRVPWKGALRVRKYVAENAIDVYHAHLPFGIFFGALLRVPRIYTHHSIKPRGGRLLYFIYNRLVSRYVGISKACSTALAAYSGREVFTITNGVDTKRFSSAPKGPRMGNDPIRLVAVGRVHPDKNYELLIRALALLPKSLIPQIKVSIAGDADRSDATALRNLALSEGLGETVQLIGNVRDIPAFLSEADIFVMTSASEGSPIALIEAAVAGVPAIVTDVGGCREIVDACGNGEVVPAGDPELFAGAIVRLCTTPELLASYRSASIERSLVYDISTCAVRHLALYEQVVVS